MKKKVFANRFDSCAAVRLQPFRCRPGWDFALIKK